MKSLMVLILTINIAMAAPAPSISQIQIPCGASSMLSSFIPCMSFLINSSPNETLPINQCCQAIRSLTAGEMDCFCLFLTGTAPFSFPIKRILATYLPQVCGISDVLFLHCKNYGSLFPASGPVSPGQSPSTPSEVTSLPHLKASPFIPSTTASSSEAPLSDTTPLMNPPSSPSVVSNSPSSTMVSGGHSLLTPSSSMPSCTVSPSFLLIAFGLAVLKYY